MTRTETPEIRVLDSADALAEAAAVTVVEAACEAVAARGRFTIALAGGATPRASYARLAAAPHAARLPWAHTVVFFGDDRGVPPDHPESNYRMAHETLLAKVPVPAEQVFRIRADADDPDAAAAEYARTIADVFKTRRGEQPRFDLILLGVGVDGHTASLFPGSPALKEVFRAVAAVYVAAANIPQRFTLTFPVLNAAARVVFLVAGPEKAKIVRAALGPQGVHLPAGMVRPLSGRRTWLLDRDAAALLPVADTR